MRLADEREAVVEGGRRLERVGLVSGASGNLSMRGGDFVAVTPTGMSIADMKPEDLAIIDMEGNWVEGRYKPTSEVPLHLAIYQSAPNALAVAHTVQCPYCIDAYTQASLEKGSNIEEMTEAVHVACAIRGGASLVHGVQMRNVAEKLSM